MTTTIAIAMHLPYDSAIRPLGVRPLIYPERVPKAWGFFVARAGA